MNCIICCHNYTEKNKQKCHDEWFSPQETLERFVKMFQQNVGIQYYRVKDVK